MGSNAALEGRKERKKEEREREKEGGNEGSGFPKNRPFSIRDCVHFPCDIAWIYSMSWLLTEYLVCVFYVIHVTSFCANIKKINLYKYKTLKQLLIVLY